MTTSVPSVISIQDLKWRIANLIERAAEAYQLTGDISGLEQSVELAHALYEELKVEGHKGRLPWDYINQYPIALAKLDNFILKVKARNTK